MVTAHDALRESLGSLALGHLPAGEAAEVRRHVAGCRDCRRELAGLAPVAARLRAAGPDDVAPPPELARRIRDAVRRESRARAARDRARRVTAACAAAAAVVAVCGLGVVAGRASAPHVAAAPVEPVAVRAAVPGIEASAGVVPHTWGVEIKLRGSGFVPGEAYAVYVTTAGGERRTAGAFVGTGARTMTCNLNSGVLRPDAAAFSVVDSAGRTVLTATLPALT